VVACAGGYFYTKLPMLRAERGRSLIQLGIFRQVDEGSSREDTATAGRVKELDTERRAALQSLRKIPTHREHVLVREAAPSARTTGWVIV